MPHLLEGREGITKFVGMEVHYFSYPQYGVQVNGFRINSFAYMTDVMELNESMYQWLDGVEWLVMNGKGWEGSPAHLSLGEAIAFAKKIGARITYFTHISHDIDHLVDSEKLPEKTKFAYDGLTFEIEAFFEKEEVADR